MTVIIDYLYMNCYSNFCMSGEHDNNRRKTYTAQSYYHIYNRGINKQEIFLDDDDYQQFMGIMKRQLSEKPTLDKINKRHYANYYGDIELLAFALMPNHFHILVYQESHEAIAQFMKSLLTGYSKFFNKKYERVGPLFQGRYRAEKICGDDTVAIVSRYIHLNPRYWEDSPRTSIDYYSGKRRAFWVNPDKVMAGFKDFAGYKKFLMEFDSDNSSDIFEF